MRRTLLATTVLLLAVLPAGCGGDDEDAYCSTLKEEKSRLADLAEQSSKPGTDVLTPTLRSLARLREASPPALRDEWDTVYYAWDAMVDAVRESGVEPRDYRPGRTPDGVSAADARRLGEVAAQLSSRRVVDATLGLEDQAREVCGVELRV